MRYLIIIALVAFFSTSFASANDEVQFRASALENVVVGQQFRVTYTVNQEAKDFRAPDLSSFSVVMGPSTSRSTSYQIINGNAMSTFSLTYTYVLMANKVGEFILQPAHVTVDGQRYASNTLRIKAVAGANPSTAQPSSTPTPSTANSTRAITDDQVFLQQTVSKKSVYEQEALVITYKLFTRYDIRDVSNLKFPDFNGFFAQEIELPKDRQFVVETIKGVNYNTIVLKQYLLYPQRSGNLKIEGTEVDVIIRLSTNVRSRGIFDIFDNFQEVKKTIKTTPENISVKPLPTTGKPSSFTGAVGELTLQAAISKQNVQVNEAVSLKMTIAGNGNLRLIKHPSIKFPLDMEVYDPKISNKFKSTPNGTIGSKEIEYIFIPRFEGVYEIMGAEFSFFDTKKKQYKTVNTPSFKLHVEGTATETSAPAALSLSLQERVKIIGDDIRFINTTQVEVLPKRSYIVDSKWFWASYTIPTLLFIFIIVLLQKQVKENANSALMKTKKANKVAKKRFLLAHRFLKERNEKAFYEEIMKALWGYLSDKLAISNANLFKENIVDELTNKGVSVSCINETVSVLKDCEFARFSSSSSSAEAMETMYQRAMDSITQLENELK